MQFQTRGYLPHLFADQATYFVTFRLEDSLPASIVEAWKNELYFQKQQIPNSKDSRQLKHLYLQKIDRAMDSNLGRCWLRNPEIASMVVKSLKHFDGERYQLHAWTVMPNHVHVLVSPKTQHSLSEIVQTWKSFTSHCANRMLHRAGPFWQREYYDRLVRSQRQFEYFVRYVLNNPVKAGLSDKPFSWQWTGVSGEVMYLVQRFFVE